MILLVGPPGAGKSVQAQLLEDTTNCVWLSTGKLLRDNLSSEMKERMAQGELINDTVVEDVLHEAVMKVSNGTRILIDGFPRRESQVAWFRGYLKGVRRNLEAIIHLSVSEKESVHRLTSRGRLDDKEQIISKRYKQYEDEILPMINHFSEKGVRVIEVSGMKSIEEVHKKLLKDLQGIV